MKSVIVALGGLVALAGFVMAVRPAPLLEYMQRHGDDPPVYAFAVIVRLLIGASLIVYASQSAFPLTLSILGWLSLAAGIGILAIGRRRLRRLIDRVIRLARPYARLAGVVAIAFGGFLIYAVV